MDVNKFYIEISSPDDHVTGSIEKLDRFYETGVPSF